MHRVYVALDIETTGLNPERDAIIEIGAVKFQGDKVLAEWSSLVNPQRPLPYKIQHLTGITQADVDRAPTLRSVINAFQDFVRDLPIIGHNICFDLSFFHRNGFLKNNAYIDTFELAAILIPYAGRYSLGQLLEELGLRLESAHRALSDARAARKLFLALLDRAAELDHKIVQEINRAARNSDWPLKQIFREIERTMAHRVFGGTIGAQLREKGFLNSAGATSLFSRADEIIPLRPNPERCPLDIEELAIMLSPGGKFAREFPGFEHRSQQVEMMRAVAHALNAKEHLMIEAGTGTGKSIAYLLPAMIFAAQNREHIVISTNTINLQDQLYTKDIPALQKILGLDIKAQLLKGRSNYLCRHRFAAFRRRPDLSAPELTVLAKVLAWLGTTTSGDVGELFLPDPRQRAVWSQINATADTCLTEKCEHFVAGNCFFYRARNLADAAHLIIVNHALLLADIAVEGRALPEYRYLIVDEAHHLESATTSQLSISFECATIEELLTEIGARARAHRPGGVLAEIAHATRRLPPDVLRAVDDLLDEIRDEGEQVLSHTEAFFTALAIFVKEHCEETEGAAMYGQRMRLTPAMRVQPGWTDVEIAADNLIVRGSNLCSRLERLRNALVEMQDWDIPGIDQLIEEIGLHAHRWADLLANLKSMASEPAGNRVDWTEISPEGQASLHSAPLHVGQLIRQRLLETKDSVIMTSATLIADGAFDFMQSRLGTEEVTTKAVGSPFDYERSTLIWIPTDIPEPRQPFHQRVVEEVIRDLSLALGGRTMVLFTSYAQLRTTARAIASDLAEAEIIVYEQGEGMSRHQLLQSFKTSQRAVLLGTRSFWEGVDIPGEALSCLVLVRLPFAVPTDPIVAARSESFEDPFREYSLPDAILRFRQGFGRLIRSKTDRGVVVILDKRILNKTYGEAFLDSLPACTVRKGPRAHLPEEARRWIDLCELPSRE